MSGPRFKATVAIALALGMWFVPSLSTQGAGTVGRQWSHPDRVLIADSDSAVATPERRLLAADAAVHTALPR